MNSFLVEAITQGEVLKECLDFYTNGQNNPLDDVLSIFNSKPYQRVLLSGMGSSLYAAYSVADYLVSNGVPTVVHNAFELSRYFLDLVTNDTLLVVISQSGKTKEVLDLVAKTKDTTTVVGVVNMEDSLLAQQVHLPVWIKAGFETQITNKSYLNSLAVLILFSAILTGGYDQELVSTLYQLADWIDSYLKNIHTSLPPQEVFVAGLTNIDLLANGPSISSALQACLGFREGPKIITCTSNCADYAHGWDKSASPGYVGVIHAPVYQSNSVEARMVKSFVEKGAKIIILTETEVPSTDSIFVINHPSVPERMASLPQIVITSTLMGWLMGEKSDRE
jgi:glucosamine--fructose-6-phosphate aminotransferase (isomerizing)